jgi:hypothetical protein
MTALPHLIGVRKKFLDDVKQRHVCFPPLVGRRINGFASLGTGVVHQRERFLHDVT